MPVAQVLIVTLLAPTMGCVPPAMPPYIFCLSVETDEAPMTSIEPSFTIISEKELIEKKPNKMNTLSCFITLKLHHAADPKSISTKTRFPLVQLGSSGLSTKVLFF